jgi:hypothetical protein
MKRIFWWLGSVLVVAGCSGSVDYNPDKSLTALEKDKFKMSIIRYAAKAPENVGRNEVFDKKHDDYFQERASFSFLEGYYKKGNDQYFLLTQPAPSVVEKRHATGGRVVLNEDGSIAEYEEIFRTWKMVPDTLKKRSYFLFDKMVKGEPLDPFYTASSGDMYIEFPDDKTVYDKSIRAWKTRE